MSGKWKVFGVAALVLCAAAFGTLAYVDSAGKFLSGWMPRWTGLHISSGPQFVLDVDSASLRQVLHETLRDDVLREMRDRRIRLLGPVRVNNAGVQLVVADADRSAAMTRLANLYDDPKWFDVKTVDGGAILVAYSDERFAERTRQVAALSASIIEARLSSLGGFRLSNLGGFRFSVLPQASRIHVQLSRSEDMNRLIDFATKPARIEFRLVDNTMTPRQAIDTKLAQGTELVYGSEKEGKRPYFIERRIIVSNVDLADVQPGSDHRTSEPVVLFRLNTNGARRFAMATQENVGRAIAILLDNEVISAPTIREPILAGYGQITGNFTARTANELSIQLRFGALPVQLNLIELQPPVKQHN